MNSNAISPCPDIGDPIPLTLRQIASWSLPELMPSDEMGNSNPTPIRPGLPSLQRGAVWKPNQVELLWDSVLRGFPIGSMVVCKRLQGQHTRAGQYAKTSNHDQCSSLTRQNSDFTHHLLDGQQRANALALGWLDPYPADQDSPDPDALLWLDLKPEHSGPSSIPASSSRRFLLRMTTVAHPWGFRISDEKEPARLAHSDASKAKEKFRELNDCQNAERPRPLHGWPLEASAPVPMAWALGAAYEVCQNVRGSNDAYPLARQLFENIFKRCEKFEEEHKSYCDDPSSDRQLRSWTLRAKDLLKDWRETSTDKLPEHAANLAKGLMRACSSRTVAIPVPDDVLSEQHTEVASEVGASVDHESVSNAEHLFNRLNRGGTDLDGDELRYSMIKAYWPGIEKTIENIDPRPPETQVALLGARVALASDGKRCRLR